MTPGLTTRTYMPQMHWQTSILQTPLRLDDQQYKETIEIPQRLLIPTSFWPPILTTTAQAFSESSKFSKTIQSLNTFNFEPTTFAPLNSFSPSCHLPCPTHPPLFLSLPAPHLLSIALVALPTLSPLLPLKALQVQPLLNVAGPMNKWSSTLLTS